MGAYEYGLGLKVGEVTSVLLIALFGFWCGKKILDKRRKRKKTKV